jgi:hypothetical protein
MERWQGWGSMIRHLLKKFRRWGPLNLDPIAVLHGRQLESAQETSGLDTSPMATAMQGLEESLLAGFGFDEASMRDKQALALGEMNLPQAIATP